MIELIMFHGATLAVCVALGVATSWWMFRGDRAPLPGRKDEGDKG